MKQGTVIPIFPLNVVLLPGESLPLHIFEERYKEMIRFCLAEDLEFGVVYTDGNEMRKVGCTAKISKVIKKYDDGRLDILTEGNQRFQINNISDERIYLQASIGYFNDEAEPESLELIELARKGIDLLDEIDKLSSHGEARQEIKELNIETISFLIAASAGIPVHRKQKLLEATSVSERLQNGIKELQTVLNNMHLFSQLKKVIRVPEKKYGFFTN
jgi:ATP-dependent Lon protease